MFESFYDRMQSELFVESFMKSSNKRLLQESSDIVQKVLDIKELPYYNIKVEEWNAGFDDKNMKMESAYSKKDKYIGQIDEAESLIKNFGIKEFDVADENKHVVTIGFNPDKEMWYGWSHRAIVGFKIGHKIFDESFGNDNTPYVKHGKETIKTMEQAKESAKNFAKYVS